MLKKVLLFIRGTFIVNIPVRSIVKTSYNFRKKLYDYCTIHWPVFGIIIFKLPNNNKVKIYSKGDDFVSTQAYWKGYDGYEGASVRLFYNIAARSNVICDIGANVGYFTIIGAGANNKAAIYAFEPVPKVYERLVKNIELNQFTKARPINAAVGNSELPLKFYVPNTKGMPLAGSTKKGWSAGSREIEVQSVSLDSFKIKNSIGKIDLIKMDCEFHEVEALKGMKEVLSIDKPVILMEVLFLENIEIEGYNGNKYHLEIEQIMKENGYYFYLINDTALVRLDKLEYNPGERNYLFSTKKSNSIYLSTADMESLLKNIF